MDRQSTYIVFILCMHSNKSTLSYIFIFTYLHFPFLEEFFKLLSFGRVFNTKLCHIVLTICSFLFIADLSKYDGSILIICVFVRGASYNRVISHV